MLSEALPSLALEVVSCAVATRFLKHIAEHYDLISAEIRSALSDFHADASVPQRRFYDTATVAEPTAVCLQRVTTFRKMPCAG